MHGDSRKRRRPRPVSELLKPGASALGRLLSRAREIERLDRQVARLLEPGLAARVRVAALRGPCLVLVTPSAAVATRLRMDADSLLETLRANGESALRELTVRVAPGAGEPEAGPRRRPLSASARDALERFAADSGDADIQAIVRRDDKDAGET